MCRITGFWDFNASPAYDPEKVLLAMRDTLAHGGPDAGGSFLDAGGRLGLAHRRLSIIDLSPAGCQPMTIGDKVIVYNGEVYNFPEIKVELESSGQSFVSHSDTEVILKALDAWGMSALNRFRGMWAFAIWDKKKRELTLCRDRLGVKPLYWYKKGGLLLFASELKAFHRHPGFQKKIDAAALSMYFSYGYIPGPNSIFENAQKLEPGHYLVCNGDGQVRTHKYWDLADSFSRPKLKISGSEAVAEAESVLRKAFAYRMVADVPVGVFLSSGYDSTAVTALLASSGGRKLKTYSIGFPDPVLDEAAGARKIAAHLGTDHNEYYCTPADLKEILPVLPEIYDEPFGDGSAVPTVLVSRFARRHVKVALSADGGDELFSGYDMYSSACGKARSFGRIPAPAAALAAGLMRGFPGGSALKLLGVSNPDGKYGKMAELLANRNGAAGIYAIYSKYFSDRQAGRLLRQFSGRDLFAGLSLAGQDSTIQELLYATAKTYLVDDIMHKVDRAAMSVGLEGREPFLDPAVIDFAASLPIGLKQNGRETKWIIRQIVRKYVPEAILSKKKQGFTAPLEKWFRAEAEGYLRRYLTAENAARTGVLVPVEVERVRDDYFSGRGGFSQAWLLLMFLMWYERWMD